MISIYVSYHKPADILSSDTLKPIQVGRALADVSLEMSGDNTGDNISNLNKSFCELTGIYWAWKNDTESDYIGFCHYRRFFCFKPNAIRKSWKNQPKNVGRLTAQLIDRLGLIDDRFTTAAVNGPDMILPYPIHFRRHTIRRQYKVCPGHLLSDLDQARASLAILAPEYQDAFDRVMAGHMLYSGLMFVLPRATFDRFCTWLFPILFDIQKNISLEGRDAVSMRVFGYLAERLFTVFVAHELEERPNLKIEHVRHIFVRRTHNTDPRSSVQWLHELGDRLTAQFG